MAASMDTFDLWLSKKLTELNPDADLDVFVQYIRSILESETGYDDLKESLMEIIQEIAEDGDGHSCEMIIKEWNLTNAKPADTNDSAKATMEDQICKLISEVPEQSVVVGKTRRTAEERARQETKLAILNQYAEVSDGEVTDSDEEGASAVANLVSNVNAQLVLDREKAMREKSKQEADAKKQTEKEEREKQKQKAEDRKEAEKKRTQKGERRR